MAWRADSGPAGPFQRNYEYVYCRAESVYRPWVSPPASSRTSRAHRVHGHAPDGGREDRLRDSGCLDSMKTITTRRAERYGMRPSNTVPPRRCRVNRAPIDGRLPRPAERATDGLDVEPEAIMPTIPVGATTTFPQRDRTRRTA